MGHINWTSLVDELRIRKRLAAIQAHVNEHHIQPRLRRLGPRISQAMIVAATEAVIEGPADGPPWEQRLKGPAPASLRDEWDHLTQRLRELDHTSRREPTAE